MGVTREMGERNVHRNKEADRVDHKFFAQMGSREAVCSNRGANLDRHSMVDAEDMPATKKVLRAPCGSQDQHKIIIVAT